jgi:hypothetical protein
MATAARPNGPKMSPIMNHANPSRPKALAKAAVMVAVPNAAMAQLKATSCVDIIMPGSPA